MMNREFLMKREDKRDELMLQREDTRDRRGFRQRVIFGVLSFFAGAAVALLAIFISRDTTPVIQPVIIQEAVAPTVAPTAIPTRALK